MRDDDGRDLPFMLGKAAGIVEGFQQEGKAEPGRPGLVRQQRQVIGQERPMLGELVGGPTALHPARLRVPTWA
jgi:hypothetical protein